MNAAERLGARLVMELRRERDLTLLLAESTAKVNALVDEIHAAPAGTLYGSRTGEQPIYVTPLKDEMPQTGGRTDPVEWIAGTSPAQKPRNQVPVPMPRPLREDRQDGGQTFALTPIADTVTMPAVVPCPRLSGGDPASCLEQAQHLHQKDGVVRRLQDL